METEFDKEIDAILRKARASGVVETVKTEHVDADVIAAFAEDALPQKSRALYMEHFADCGHCRKLLAETAAWPPAEPKTAAAAAMVGAVSAPWYSKLFRAPGLALAFGALVVVFGGALIFLVVDRKNADSTASLQENAGSRADGTYSAPSEAPAAANSMAANMSANVTANSGMTAPTPAGAKAETSPGRGPATNDPAASGTTAVGEPAPVTVPKVAAIPPPETSAPPPAPEAQPPAEDKKAEEKESSTRDDRMSTADLSREGSPMALKKAGPNRAAGPRQRNAENSQNNVQGYAVDGAAGGASATRSAGGKSFARRDDGIWYDSAYRGQSTKKVTRGSSAYNKLDPGLRSIASGIGGTVVIVWKEKAYKIQ